MAGSHITVTVSPQTAEARLQHLQTILASPGEMLAQVGEHLMRTTKDRFRSQIASDGTPWQALQPRYQRRKKKNKDKILTLSADLRRFITWQPDGQDAVKVGSNRKYAAIHQFGGTIQKKARQSSVHFGVGKAKHLFVKKSKAARSKQVTIGAHEVTIPARPFLGLSAHDRREITEITLEWLQR
ncbi:MAG: phage virion morphogenesis protein [Comamonas sp.]|nr:phage virion morphogenesis protein [Comamonas sp.]